MNLAYIFGLLRYLRGSQNMAWKVTPRQPPAEVLSAKGGAQH